MVLLFLDHLTIGFLDAALRSAPLRGSSSGSARRSLSGSSRRSPLPRSAPTPSDPPPAPTLPSPPWRRHRLLRSGPSHRFSGFDPSRFPSPSSLTSSPAPPFSPASPSPASLFGHLLPPPLASRPHLLSPPTSNTPPSGRRLRLLPAPPPLYPAPLPTPLNLLFRCHHLQHPPPSTSLSSVTFLISPGPAPLLSSPSLLQWRPDLEDLKGGRLMRIKDMLKFLRLREGESIVVPVGMKNCTEEKDLELDLVGSLLSGSPFHFPTLRLVEELEST